MTVSGNIDFLELLKNSDSIDEIITSRIRELEDKGKNSDTDPNYSDSAWHFTIGTTKIGKISQGFYRSTIDGYISSNIHLNVLSGIMSDEVNLCVDDVTEAYKILVNKIKSSTNIDFDGLMKLVYDTTVDYFGTTEQTIPKREQYYNNLYYDEEKDIVTDGKLSDFKGKNMAACNERAALSQNLMSFLGVDTTYKVSPIKCDGKNEVHAYNLVSYGGKYYVFDSTMPRINDDKTITPIIVEIPEEAFNELKHRVYDEDDISIKTEFDSLRGHRKVQYNSWSENIIDTTSNIQTHTAEEIGEAIEGHVSPKDLSDAIKTIVDDKSPEKDTTSIGE